MSDAQDDGPPLLRPIPRRPFNFNIREPTPPDEIQPQDGEDDLSSSPVLSSSSSFLRDINSHRSNNNNNNNNNNNRNPPPPALNLDSLNSRLLRSSSRSRNRNNAAAPTTPSLESGPVSSSISRAQSILNLTGSTLMGIYTPGTYGPDRASSLFADGSRDGDDYGDGPGTPWGTGAETPARQALAGLGLGLGLEIGGGGFGREGEGEGEEEEEEEEEEEGGDEEDGDEEDAADRERWRRRRSSQYTAEVMSRRRSSLIHPNPSRPQQQQQQQQQTPSLLPSKRPPPSPSPRLMTALLRHLVPRALLLSALGVLYGVMVARVLDRFLVPAPSLSGAPAATAGGGGGGSSSSTIYHDWRYMAFWGTSGVVLGGLLPWFDGVWEGAFGRRRRDDGGGVDGDAAAAATVTDGVSVGVGAAGGVCGGAGGVDEEAAVPGPGWSLAVRGIGAFAGIAFAIVSFLSLFSTFLSLSLSLFFFSKKENGPTFARIQI